MLRIAQAAKNSKYGAQRKKKGEYTVKEVLVQRIAEMLAKADEETVREIYLIACTLTG